jgi:hypothetical protein
VAELPPDGRRKAALKLLGRELEALLARARALGVDPRALQVVLGSLIEERSGREHVKEEGR